MKPMLSEISVFEDLPKVDYVVKNINAFELVGKFMVAARTAGWPEANLKLVVKDATSSHNHHLRTTLARYCKQSTIQ